MHLGRLLCRMHRLVDEKAGEIGRLCAITLVYCVRKAGIHPESSDALTLFECTCSNWPLHVGH